MLGLTIIRIFKRAPGDYFPNIPVYLQSSRRILYIILYYVHYFHIDFISYYDTFILSCEIPLVPTFPFQLGHFTERDIFDEDL